jgi:cholesterol transport system auxiliary component
MNLRHNSAAFALGMLLGGCSLLPRVEAPNVYLLPATPPLAAAQHPAQQGSLRVVTPQASRTLDSTRIAVSPQGNTITSYEGARWSDPAPRLLRDRLMEAFRADGRFAAVSSNDAQLHAELELTGDLRAFQSEYVEGMPVVVVSYDAQLVRSRSQKIVATRRFDIRQPVAGKEVPQVVQAFGRATDQLAAQLITWIAASATRTTGE